MSNWKTHPPGVFLNKKPILLFFLYAAALFLVLFCTYHEVFNNFFFADDGKWLLKAQQLKDDPLLIFKPIDGKFRPLVFLVFFLEYSMFGHNPEGYFYVNLFFHYVNALLIYFFARALCKNYFTESACNTAAVFTSFLFAIQSMVCVPVLWISLQHDLLNATFYLLSLITYIRYADTRNFKYYIFSFLFFALSLTTKETGASIPAVLVLVHVFIYKKIDKKTCFLLLPHSLAVTLFLLYYPGTPLSAKSVSSLCTFTTITSRHIVEAVRSLFGFSQNKTLWLEPYFSHALFHKMNIARFILAISLSVLIFVALKGFFKSKHSHMHNARIFIFCTLWMILTFLPHFPLQYLILWEWVAFSPGYHYFYLSTLGLCFLTSTLLTTLLETCSHGRFKYTLICALAISLFLNNLIPVLHIERVYSYHAATLHYLIDQIHSAASHNKNTQIFLVNFPSQYQSLHYASLPHLAVFFNSSLKMDQIHWSDQSQLKTHPALSSNNQRNIILFYKAPFDIRSIPYRSIDKTHDVF